MHRLSDEERMKTKEKFNFHFKKCPRPLTRERLQERENTESNWEA